jgi:hypothetical protein
LSCAKDNVLPLLSRIKSLVFVFIYFDTILIIYPFS